MTPIAQLAREEDRRAQRRMWRRFRLQRAARLAAMLATVWGGLVVVFW